MASVAPLPLLSVFVSAIEASSTNINNGTVDDLDVPTIDEPEARPDAKTPTATKSIQPDDLDSRVQLTGRPSHR